MTHVVEGQALTQDYVISAGMFGKPKLLRAVKGANFAVEQGKTLAIVGESGSGKSTLARIIALIDPATGGTLKIDGQPVAIGKGRVPRALRSKVQMVFQNPYGSLNPRQKVGDVLMEPLLLNTDMPASERHDRAEAMLKRVGLGPEHFNRYPHMFSGGQRQRIAIARAIMLNPKLLVLARSEKSPARQANRSGVARRRVESRISRTVFRSITRLRSCGRRGRAAPAACGPCRRAPR
ncbi:ATP-binding cassette domain-containing protein [Mangrovicoccus ximenensis]|uniref:ATP-binding cassette domain-containing protein n=1 Tax=Mangrovicoccus ximenensis TaxID=1911570 RepID=UPI001EFF7A09|nr:ATP-binding cassette domain-containing protein [Mangrovicoccus ximenensis]